MINREDTLPYISCLCTTFCRPKLLNEAIQSFLNQDYQGHKELIVLNDFDQQNLIYEHEHVSIVNIKKKFRTIGEKRNFIASIAKGDVFFPWDDDDISLPFRVSQSINFMIENKTDYYKPNSAFFWNNGFITEISKNSFHAQGCYTKELFYSLNGYSLMSHGEDLDFDSRIYNKVGKDINIKNELNYYLYRWGGTNSYHLSSLGDDLNESKLYLQFKLQSMRKIIPSGNIKLKPTWNNDYMLQRNNYLDSIRTF